jgi:hypothetical protein
MTPHGSRDELGELLRSHTPDPRPSPGLERRIMHALPDRRKGTGWAWFALPPALALVALMLAPADRPAAPTAAVPAPPAEAAEAPVVTALVEDALHPLERETAALQRDARRAGRFLIDCLPSLGHGN